MSHTAKRLRYILPGVATVILLYLISTAFTQMSAAMHYYKANNRLVQWAAQGNIASNSDYENTKSTAKQAVKLSNNNPLYLDVLADVYQWGLYQNFESNSAKVVEEAMQLYQLSIQNRPVWPVTWANMAMLKWRINEFDSEFKLYLNQADKLGRSQPEVHLLFTELGLAAYKARHPLYTEYQQRIKHRLYQALLTPQSRDRALALIDKYELQRTTCRWLLQKHHGFVLQVANC